MHVTDSTFQHQARRVPGLESIHRGGQDCFDSNFKRNYTLTQDGYLMIPNGEATLLLDTGSPFSFGQGLERIPGVAESPPEEMAEGLTIPWLVEHIHHHFDGLIGAEVLQARTLTIDPVGRTVELSGERIGDTDGVPIRDMMNVPIFEGTVAGRTTDVIFDTGAPLGFVPRKMVANRQPVDRIAEFYPLVGPFETDVYKLPIQIGNECPTLRFGILPDEVEQMHAEAELPVLIGLELLDHYVVSVGLRERRLQFHAL
jgi:hypothetical protein